MSLSLVVTPGKRFQAGEQVTNAKLNQLATPTVQVSGTVGSTDLAPGDYSAVLEAAAYCYGVDTGTPSAAVVNLTPAPANLVDGMVVAFKVQNTSTGPCTLNIGVGGANPVLKNGFQPVGAGDWRPGKIVVCRYRLDANIVPVTAVYDGSGNYTLAVLQGQTYTWTPGNDDTQIVNGAQTLVAQGTFIAAGSTVTLQGTASTSVTATVVQASNLWQMLSPSANLQPQFNNFRGASNFRGGERGLVPGPPVLIKGNVLFLGSDGKWDDVVGQAVAQAQAQFVTSQAALQLYNYRNFI